MSGTTAPPNTPDIPFQEPPEMPPVLNLQDDTIQNYITKMISEFFRQSKRESQQTVSTYKTN